MSRTKSVLGIGLLAIVALCLGGIPETVFADTVSVSIDGTSQDIEYEGTNVSISSADVDTDFISLIFSVDVTNDGTLEITFPRNVFDAKYRGADDEFIVIADGDEMRFTETETTDTSRTLSIDLDAGTEEIEIIGTGFGNESTTGKSDDPSGTDDIDPPEPRDDPQIPRDDDDPESECPANYDPVCGMDGRTYANMCILDADNVAPDYLGECTREDPIKPTPTITCDEGMILREGVCIDACGDGLVFEDGACVFDKSAPSNQDIAVGDNTQKKTPAPNQTGSNRDLAVGIIAAFIIALIVILILGLIARVSRS